MRPILPDFTQARMLVVGDLMLDRYWHGDTQRISPEAPVPVVHVQDQLEQPGGAGNVALNLTALGAQTTLLSLIGADEPGRSLDKHLRAAGVHCDLISVVDHPTITKLRVLGRHQQLIRLDFEHDFDANSAKSLFERFEEHLKSADVVVLSDYGKGALRYGKAMIQLANQYDIPVLVDPKTTDFHD